MGGEILKLSPEISCQPPVNLTCRIVLLTKPAEAHSEWQRGCLTASHVLIIFRPECIEEGVYSLPQKVPDTTPGGYEQGNHSCYQGTLPV